MPTVAITQNPEIVASREDKTAVTRPDTLRAVLQFQPTELVVTTGSGDYEHPLGWMRSERSNRKL